MSCAETIIGVNLVGAVYVHSTLLPHQVNRNFIVNFLSAIPEACIAFAETIAGFALTVIFGPLAVIFLEENCAAMALTGLGHLVVGLGTLLFSAGNILTIGILGSRISGYGRQIKERMNEMGQSWEGSSKEMLSGFMESCFPEESRRGSSFSQQRGESSFRSSSTYQQRY